MRELSPQNKNQAPHERDQEDSRQDPRGFQRPVPQELAKEDSSFVQFLKKNTVTSIILACTIAIYFVEMMLSRSFSVSVYVMLDMGAMYGPYINDASGLWRFIAPILLHFDLMHLLFNMGALFMIGPLLEQVLGRLNFFLLYFVSGFIGNLASFIFQYGGVSAGASTSVFGLFVAAALLSVLMKGPNRHLASYSKGMWTIIGINILYSILIPSISLVGHMGGAVGGALVMLFLPSKKLKTPVWLRIIVAVVVAAGILGLLFYFNLIG